MDLPSLTHLIEVVKATDEDADHRLPLVEQAAPVLYEGAIVSESEKELLAEKFERWRYQRLNKFGANLSANEHELSVLLDLITGKLLNSGRLPKATRVVLNSKSWCALDVATALDVQTPLDQITEKAADVTADHFSKRSRAQTNEGSRQPQRRWPMQLYAPLYLSNYCVNHCLYCGFRFPNELDRVHLNDDRAMTEAEILHAQGHRHLLVVAGDFPKLTSTDYLVNVVDKLVARGFRVAVEIAPQSTVSYRKLVRAGAIGVTLYQETYQEQLYYRLHPRGPKIWFDWRLEALERAAEAGMKRLGLGILLGLANPLLDLQCLIRHGLYLRDRYPQLKLAFSLPRIHEAPDGFKPEFAIADDTFIRLYCALRFAFPDAELVLSTRETGALRDRLARICITQMSAGSCTAPGGYASATSSPKSREQFPVYDQRSTLEVAAALEGSGFDVRWEID